MMNKAELDLQNSSIPSLRSVDKLVVGLEDEQEIIKNKLTRGTINLDFVSIVGMGGIGKTTMAKKLYHELEYDFHIRAFCCVSQTYDKTKLLLEILSQVTELPKNAERMSYEDLGEILCRGLRAKRYLIVMDDVWEIGAWKDLGIFFPNDRNRSRILFTRRQNDVVLQVKRDSFSHCLRLLSEEESWELLEKKVFLQGSCPPHLLGMGRKITKSCQGLPLAIVVVAGILARAAQEQDKWEEIAESVSTEAQIECSHIFELSYRYLPQHLKPCFLYLAAFQEDFQIPVRKLIQLWIAEEFIRETEDRSLEDVAEDYLRDLIGRNLVMVSERRSIGGCKKCHLHDLMLDFCLGKAREEKFMQRIQGHDLLTAIGSLDASNPRLCSYYRGQFENLSTFLFNPSLSSLLFFRGIKLRYLEDWSFISSLKHLTVLDLAVLLVTEHFFDMELPTELRYLAVSGIIEYIPPSISHLSKLETLVVTASKAIDLPDSIWEMVTLRHLLVDGYNFFKLPEPIGKLENLETLCLLQSLDVGAYHDVFRALPGLRRLKFSSTAFTVIFQYLTKLESLHIDFYRRSQNFYIPDVFPLSIKKLTISDFVFYPANFLNIGMLPNLEVLKILSGHFASGNWDVTDLKLLKLKFLKLSRSNIVRWNASSDNFPSLEKLVVHRCAELESIPSCFGDIPTLQLIDVQWCKDSVISSVRQIQDEQMNMGNGELEVHIHPLDFKNISRMFVP